MSLQFSMDLVWEWNNRPQAVTLLRPDWHARFLFRYCIGPKITCGVFRGALQKWNKKCHCLSSSEPQHHSVFYYFSSDILSLLESTWLPQLNERMGNNPFAKVTSWETDGLLHTCFKLMNLQTLQDADVRITVRQWEPMCATLAKPENLNRPLVVGCSKEISLNYFRCQSHLFKTFFSSFFCFTLFFSHWYMFKSLFFLITFFIIISC